MVILYEASRFSIYLTDYLIFFDYLVMLLLQRLE